MIGSGRTVTMVRRLGALAVVGLALSACATHRAVPPVPPPSPEAPEPGSTPGAAAPLPKGFLGYRCPPESPCGPKEKSPHRQYYDAHHRRYYYYDPATRRYYWETGQPKV